MADLRTKKAFIFDLDGVIYLGDTLIEGAEDTIEILRKKDKRVMFLTNNSTNSREGFCNKLNELGIKVKSQELLTSSYATAFWLKKNYKKGRVFVVGEEGLKEELRYAGFEIVNGNADFVVVGLDRKFNYKKLMNACFALQKGAKLISTNQDATYPTEKGILPGGGSLVSALRTCSGKEVLRDIGKPNRYMLDMALNQLGLNNHEVAFIGDRIDTDIAMAKNVGLTSILVLSGVTKINEASKADTHCRPDFILNSVSDLKKFI